MPQFRATEKCQVIVIYGIFAIIALGPFGHMAFRDSGNLASNVW